MIDKLMRVLPPCGARAARSLRLLSWLVLSLTLCVAPAWAQPVDEAKGKELASEAMDQYKEGKFAEALELFKQARAIYPTAQVLRMTGYTLIGLQRWAEAVETLEEALKTDFKPLLPRDAEDAQDNLNSALTHIAIVEVVSSVAGATVIIDGGEPHPVPYEAKLEPGAHTFVVTADKHDHAEAERELEAGSKTTVELDPTPLEVGETPKPLPKPKPRPKPEPEESSGDMYGWFPYQGPIGLGVAGLGLAFGIAGMSAGLYGASLESAVQENIDAHNTNYDASCSVNRDLCLNDIALINRDGETAKSTIDVGLGLGITGAVLFTTGVVLFLFSDDSPLAGDGDRVSATCVPGAGFLSCVGRF